MYWVINQSTQAIRRNPEAISHYLQHHSILFENPNETPRNRS
jgi:hypothetical protein